MKHRFFPQLIRATRRIIASPIWVTIWSPTHCAAAVAVLVCAFPGQSRSQEGYLINVGDILELDILDDSDPAVRFVVGTDGAIQLPFVGGISVRGLPVDVARESVRQTYVDRQIFVDPAVELSIAAFRPVFVLGDVEAPGYYDFQSFLTPEQALGLAGGPTLVVGNIEARILERRNLEGALTSIEMDLANAAVEYARTRAQLRGDLETRYDDVPADIRIVLDEDKFVGLSASQNEIIAVELGNHTTQSRLLLDMIAEAETEIDLLEEREVAQQSSVARTRENLARGEELEDRGVQTATALSELFRLVDAAEDQLLQIRAQQSNAVRRLAELQRDLSTLESQRQQRFLTEGQEKFIELSKLDAERSSILDRLELLQRWSDSSVAANLENRVEFVVRRRIDDGVETFAVTPTDELHPGDLLIVTVSSPSASLELGQ